jgi:branched-chain amino acid transport system ATP-binding protein
MLAIGRALLTRPKLVLLDEPSIGLAPIIVEEIFELISNLNKRLQLGFLVAEQNMNVSLRHAHRGFIPRKWPDRTGWFGRGPTRAQRSS